MSIFEFHKEESKKPVRDVLSALRETLQHLETEPEESPRIANLKIILAHRITELERKSA